MLISAMRDLEYVEFKVANLQMWVLICYDKCENLVNPQLVMHEGSIQQTPVQPYFIFFQSCPTSLLFPKNIA